MALDFAAGCLGGCAGIMVGYPLDTVKIHMQTQDYRNPTYRGTWHCFRTIIMKESVLGLYRGMSSPMAGVAAVNAIVFGVYGQTQRHLTETNSLHTHFLAGACAGIAQTPICSPIELAKTRLQLQSPNQKQFSGPLHCLRHIFKQEGYRGVFKGVGITLCREAPSYGVYFLTYEALMKMSTDNPPSTAFMLLAGGVAGTTSWVISYPLDVIKSRVQAETSNRYTGAVDCFKKSVKAEGYSCLFRGLNSTIVRAFPTNAATFAVVSWTFRLFDAEAYEVPTKQQATEAVGSQSAGRARAEHECFLDKWSKFAKSVTSEQILSRSYYSTLSMLTPNEFMIGNSINCQEDTCIDGLLEYGVLEQIEDTKCGEENNERLQ